jgi:hypothetical protein
LIVIFTGTRAGMTDVQRRACFALLQTMHHTEPFSEAHHGDCVGADEQFHRMCFSLRIPVVLHPCNLEHMRAHCDGDIDCKPPLPPLKRNHVMVELLNHRQGFLLAAPNGLRPETRSGTWATVRYADDLTRPIVIVWPNGNYLPKRYLIPRIQGDYHALR